MDKYMVGLYFMSNLCIPSRLGQFEVKLMELCKLQLGIYLEHHCNRLGRTKKKTDKERDWMTYGRDTQVLHHLLAPLPPKASELWSTALQKSSEIECIVDERLTYLSTNAIGSPLRFKPA
jgi:hypothetical protein